MTPTRFSALALAVAGSLWPIVTVADDGLVVAQQDKQFSSTDLTMTRRGQAITFVNRDRVRHNIAVQAPDGQLRTGIVQDPGRSDAISFDQPGDYRVFCLIHPKMSLTVHVP